MDAEDEAFEALMATIPAVWPSGAVPNRAHAAEATIARLNMDLANTQAALQQAQRERDAWLEALKFSQRTIETLQAELARLMTPAPAAVQPIHRALGARGVVTGLRTGG